jgi:hypothetical protein
MTTFGMLLPSPENTFDKGLRYEALREYFEAMGLFLQVVKVRPNWPEPRFHLGIANVHLHQIENALEQVESLKKLNTELAEELDNYVDRHRKR